MWPNKTLASAQDAIIINLMGNEDSTEKIPFEEQVLEQLSSINSRLSSLETRLESLETRVDERLRETRPIWEQALKEIMDVKEEVKSTNSQLYIPSSRDLRQEAELLTLKNRVDRMDHDPNAPTSRLP